ncbi:hypothetical protein F0L68_38910 [Solihabitans fulvus]|uniref:Uncharacterized protein n=1 Tax=Solihabitans fulvus TaxID=1892852 RepID=A0A5B2WIF9_9PSEU|nr:hypothetical protein [Solihabitans fulvus]KAA2250119.1 hypothetical protein F0L68_38910 [Solihabitans fulvus]
MPTAITPPVARLGLLAAAALVAGVLGAAPATAAPSTTLYAAPTGSGTACTWSNPCSLTGARDKVRTLNNAMTGDLTVRLRGGTYRLTDTVKFGPADSGSNGHAVLYQANPGEHPMISGAIRVTGFGVYDQSKGIYRAPVPAGTASRQLFVNGTRAQRARGPLDPGGFQLSGSSFVTADPSYASFTNPSAVEVVRNNAWKQMRCPLASITATGSGGSSLNVNPDCWRNNNTAVPNPSFPLNGAGLPRLDGVSWVENAYQLLTQPGQFYLDGPAGYLYYAPRPGENLASADVELPVLENLVDLSGTPGHLAPVNDTDPAVGYTGSWGYSSGRPYGDFHDDVHYTTTDGDSVSYTFTGTGLDVLGEVNSDEGGIDVYVDGVRTRTVTPTGATRLAQQAVVSIAGLPKGQHTVKLVKTGGQYLVVDGFTVVPDAIAPVHDIRFSGVDFGYTTWNQPSTAGYVDNQAGVLWDPVTQAPIRIPAAVRVHRGSGISFSGGEIAHTGGTGIDLADGTQNSSVTGNWIHDTSGGGVSLGEVDDFYLTDPARMSSGDTISENTIEHVGADYQDAVGIWVGHGRSQVVSHNDVGHTPYSGMSLGWGWGWASTCDLQSKQGLGNPCRHGTIYSGGNQILNNHLHDVMGVLNDGGPIYTLGGQGGGDGSLTSVLAGNVVSGGNHTNNMLYHDEGSSYWNTHDNLVRFGGQDWMGMWTPTIHDITVHDNYSDYAANNINGTNITFAQATVVAGGNWPPAARAIIAAAGVDPAFRRPGCVVDDDDLAIGYTGAWFASGARGYGDLNDNVHATQTNGDAATFSFNGTAISVLGERNSDQGQVEIVLDGVSKGLVDTSSATRQTRQAIYRATGLGGGQHTVQVIKRSGTFATLDGFQC